MNLQQRHYLAAMNGGSKIVAALKDENPSAAKEVVESTLMGKAAEQIQENVGPAVDKSPINEGMHKNEDFQKGLQAGYLYASHCYKEAMMRREGMHNLRAAAHPMRREGWHEGYHGEGMHREGTHAATPGRKRQMRRPGGMGMPGMPGGGPLPQRPMMDRPTR